MKLRKAAAVILVCSILVGQTVWAQEAESENAITEEVQESQKSGDVVETQDVQEETLQEDNAEKIEEPEQVTEIKEASNTDNVGINAVSLNLYTGYDLIKSVSADAAEIRVDNEAVCNIELVKEEKYTYLKFQILKSGKTYVEIKDEFNRVIEVYDINVDELPTTAVPITDIVLRSHMIFNSSLFGSSLDADKNGYISRDELEKVTYMDFRDGYIGQSIKSLEGLEYAVNLKSICLAGNEELTNVDALFQLENLESINIRNTSVSDEERWNLAGIGDTECNKGDKVSISELDEFLYLFEEMISVEEIENEGIVGIDIWSDYIDIRGLKVGKAKLKIGYKNFSKEITVTVNGIDYNQEVGNTYTDKVGLIEGWQWNDEVEIGGSGVAILKENGELWLTYPEPRKVKDNAKQCLIRIIPDSRNVIYILDKDNILWNEEEQLAEDVVKFDEYYALNGQNNLKNVHTGEIIENVRDWHVDEYSSDGYTLYVLMDNGDLYGRCGSNIEAAVQGFEKIKSGVTVLESEQFLCEDGTVYDYEDVQTPVATDVKKFLEQKVSTYYQISAYYDKSGSLHVRESKYDEYVDLGKLNVAQIEYINSRYGGDSGQTIVILTEENEVYAYKKGIGISKIDTDVKLLGFRGGWVYQKFNNEYYTIEDTQGKKINVSRDEPMVIDGIMRADAPTGENYRLEYTATEEDCIVVRTWSPYQDGDEVELLNHVEKIWRDRGYVYALRTDGTIWDITNVPKMVLDLATNTYVPGDVNEDGVVNIEDLRIVLRGVCGKIDLTERQIQIADVETDNQVDIQDLRKILRFVCGKITEL